MIIDWPMFLCCSSWITVVFPSAFDCLLPAFRSCQMNLSGSSVHDSRMSGETWSNFPSSDVAVNCQAAVLIAYFLQVIFGWSDEDSRPR